MMMMMKQKHQQLGEEGGVLMTEDLYTVGNDEVYIVFMEDSATLTTEGTDDDYDDAAAEDACDDYECGEVGPYYLHRYDGHSGFGR